MRFADMPDYNPFNPNVSVIPAIAAKLLKEGTPASYYAKLAITDKTFGINSIVWDIKADHLYKINEATSRICISEDAQYALTMLRDVESRIVFLNAANKIPYKHIE